MIRSRVIDRLKSLDALIGRPAARWLRGRARPLPTAPPDVLVVRLWGLGNLVRLAPLLTGLGERRVRLLTLERNAAFARRHLPGVALLTIPDPTTPRVLAAALRVAWTLARERPQVIVDAETFLRLPTLLARVASGAPVVGLDTPGQGRSALLDARVAYDPTRHVADTYAALFAAAGLPTPPRGSPWSVDVRPSRVPWLRATSEPTHPLALLHPGTGDHFPGRRWPSERFGALAARLARDGFEVAITGSADECALAQAVVAASGGVARSLAGCVPCEELADLLAGATLVVSNDTGPLHLADALGVPVVGLFGPNTPHRYGPRGGHSLALHADLPCSPCLDDRLAKRSDCRRPLCMEALDVDAVHAACRQVLAMCAEREHPVAVPR